MSDNAADIHISREDIDLEPQIWRNRSILETLSEEFIRENQDKVDWLYIVWCEKLSKEFIIEFAEKINFNILLLNNNISDEIKDFCRIFI